MNATDAAPTKARLMSGDEYRESLRRLHPGWCCDAGCTTPGQAVMAPMPSPRDARRGGVG